MTRTTRRAFVVAVGGAASAALAWWAGGHHAGIGGTLASRPSAPSGASADYVDRDGWILSVEDAEKIDAREAAPSGLHE